MCKQITALFVMICCALSIQAQQLSFHTINSMTPAPSVETNKLFQDSEGYLWISTNGGLLRYDGYDFLTIKEDKSTNRQVLSGVVKIVSEDASGVLWIGTANGLYKIDRNDAVLSKICFPVLETCRVEAILPSREGSLYVATNRGLFLKPYGSSEFVWCSGKEWSLDPTDMKTLVQDDAGYIWIGTWADGLIRFDPRTRKSFRFSHIPELHSPHTLFIDKDRNLWIGTWGSGLVRLGSPYNNTDPQPVVYRKGHAGSASILDDIIYSISQDPLSGDLWVGSRSGLSILRYGDILNHAAKFVNYAPTDESHDLPFNEINSILPTRDNLIWLSSGGGIFFTDPRPKLIGCDRLEPIRKKFGTNSVRALNLSSDSVLRMYIAGFGLTEYNLEHRTFHNYGVNYINTFHEVGGDTGEVLVGTEVGIWSCRKGHAPVKMEIHGFSDPFVTSFCEEPDGVIWVGTRTDAGYLSREGRYVNLNSILSPMSEKMPLCFVKDIKMGNDGSLWIATAENGIFRLGKSMEGYVLEKVNSGQSKGVNCIYADNAGRIWVGTDNGLLSCRAVDRSLVADKSDDSGFLGGTIVTNIWEDRRGSLWATTNRGIIQIGLGGTGAEGDIHIYTKEDGLLDLSFPHGAVALKKDGTAIIGSAHGLQMIPPIDVPKKSSDCKTVITDFLVFDKSIRELPEETKRRITPFAIGSSDEFFLRHDQNNFKIEFSQLNYRGSQSALYSYRLEGYDPDWVYSDSRHRSASYNNLKAGKYRFLVRASVSGSGWCEPLAVTVKVGVAPWLSWWAYCLYALFAALIIGFMAKLLYNRMKMQKKLELAEINRRKSEELNHTKLQFFTNITHELMTPLTIILAAVEELKAEEPERKQYDFITENAMRLMRLIQQILEFRKAESGNLKLKVKEGDLTAFTKNCVVAFQPLAAQKRISYNFVADEAHPLIGWFDSDKLDKILYNLLSNASKYNRECGSVTVSIEPDLQGRSLVLKVSDTGDGMSEEQMKTLFQRFYDGDYRKHNTIGTGIGLSLVNNLVELHHGKITVDSKVGEGTTFTVILPITSDAYSASEKEDGLALVEPAAKTPTLSQPGTEENPGVVLVVEDNDDLRYLLTSHLEKSYSVIDASSADEAVGLLSENTPVRLILSDIMMPGMNGYDFCAYVKNRLEYCHIPVILITAKQTSADKITGYEVGADAYMTKPFDMDVLDAVIAGQLRRVERTGANYRRQLVFNPGELNYTTMDERFLQKAVDYVNEHLSDFDFSLADFIKAMNMSRSTFAEKMKSLTGMTPSAFVNDIRLNAAYRILQQKSGTKVRVSELAYTVGFNDPKYFSTLFKKKFGISPGEFSSSSAAAKAQDAAEEE